MGRPVILSLALIGLISPVLADTTFVGGEIEEAVWDLEGSPYVVIDDVIIVSGGSLIIEPGVTVLFSPYIGMFGDSASSISAIGTAEDSIYFLPLEDDSWGTLIFFLSELEFDYSYFYDSFGRFQESGTIGGSVISLNVSHSSFIRCETAINAYYGPINIEDCFFDNITFTVLAGGDSITARRCVFGDFSTMAEYLNLTNSIIMNVGGANLGNGSIVEGNIFIDCGNGLGGNSLTVTHNLIFGDYDVFGDDDINDFGVLSRTNVNGDSTDAYGNLFMDPLLAGGDTWPDRYFLTAESPCIDAGDPDSERDPDGTIADIGPFYFHQYSAAGSDFILHPSYLTLSVLPNPFNQSSVISYQLSVGGMVNLSLYDINGRLVRTLVDGWQAAGEHRATISGQPGMSVLPAGIYIIRLEAAGTAFTRKAVAMK